MRCACRDGGGFVDDLLQVAVVAQSGDVALDGSGQVRRECFPKRVVLFPGKGGDARQEGGESDVTGGIQWGHGGSL